MEIFIILGLIGIVIELVIAIVVWLKAYECYKALKRQERRDQLIDRIRERAEDSGNESDGDTEELEAILIPEDRHVLVAIRGY
ncbi:vpu protein [Simian immunodeficiency virus]|uniref:Protein Vpu n=1 Tax=Simian immunodeficiency virus TaxID=11723 RepID=B0LB99_SIV|nr:vpu protein [Simian immunodeficiency virus]AFJ52176.1 vpu protein [Simian immunodeficiency virus]QEE94790.1 Vpu [synthetic construct]UYP40468.1 vpu protein [synthetic construct]